MLPFDSEKQGFLFVKSGPGTLSSSIFGPGQEMYVSCRAKYVFTAVSISIGLTFKFIPRGGLWTNSRPLLAESLVGTHLKLSCHSLI